MSIDNIRYCPVVSTRDAEFRGFSELSKKTADVILPIVEITRSRRSKKNPIGDVHKSLDRAIEAREGRPFVIDVCGLESQANSQTSQLLDSANGFENWVSFLNDSVPSFAVPVLHLEEEFNEANFVNQINSLTRKFSRFALRVPTSYSFHKEALVALRASIRNDQSFISLLDAGYVKEINKSGALVKLKEMAQECSFHKPELCTALSSSFPISVVGPGYGEDAEGEFPLTEVEIADSIKAICISLGIRGVNGDYSLIHPEDFLGTVTNWVPRVDFPLDKKLYYHRVRRHDGGYGLCAKRVLSDPRYKPIKCWGADQVQFAATGSPGGKSPSFWISVRLNMHIERQVIRLK